jgi:hypothetical protein
VFKRWLVCWCRRNLLILNTRHVKVLEQCRYLNVSGYMECLALIDQPRQVVCSSGTSMHAPAGCACKDNMYVEIVPGLSSCVST